jgi:hypothetical protein
MRRPFHWLTILFESPHPAIYNAGILLGRFIMKSTILAFATMTLFASSIHAQGEGLEQLLSRARIATSSDLSHIDGSVYAQGNQPICAFGVVQLPKEKPQYSYFVLFKPMAKSKDEFTVTGPGRSGGTKLDYTVIVNVGDKKFPIAHKFAIDSDTKKVTVDELKVNDKPIEAGKSRFFVVDLSCVPPSVVAVDRKMPEAVPDPSAEGGELDAV